MTEYDYSPQAWERYIATQQRIARWVDGTLQQHPCNAFTPATPHVQAIKLQEEKKQRRKEERRAYHDAQGDSDVSDDYDSRYARSSHSRHRKTQSTKESSASYRSPRRDHSRERERERRDRDHQDRSSSRRAKPERADKPNRKDKEYVWVERSPTPPSTTRARSSSQSVSSKPRPSYGSRTTTTPHLALDLPPFPQRPQDPYYYHNRYSGDSSQSSATTPNSGSTTHGMFPAGQPPPHSAPAATGQAPKPHRSQTMPFTYTGYQQVTDKNGYPVTRPVGSQPVVLPIRPTMTGAKSYGGAMPFGPDPSKAPQLPYSAYQSPTKSQSLLKRMFGFKASKNTNESTPPPPQPYYSPPEGTMFLGGGKRVARKRSISF